MVWNKATRTFHSSDFLDTEEVIQLVGAYQDDITKNVSILSTQDNNGTFEFQIDSIRRKEDKTNISLTWDGKTIGFATKGSENYKMPAMGDFKLTDIHVSHHLSQKLQIIFSDHLEDKQLLDGLI